MFRFKKTLVTAVALLPLLSVSVFAQVRAATSAAAPASSGDAIAAYVFGEENARNAEELAEALVTRLANARAYSAPRRGARGFFREVEQAQARLDRRGRLLDDRDFCRIGTDYELNYLTVIDIEKAGRGNSIFARILNLSNCSVVASAEFTGLIRNTAEINAAADALSRDLQRRQVIRRGGQVVAAPPPPPPARRGNQIAAYVFGEENSQNAEALAESIVNGLVASPNYSAPRRGAREFFREADRAQARQRNRLLEDRDFCRIGTDFEIEYLTVIDIERAGRGNSVWARILDLETCRVIATGESTALIRNAAEIRAVSDEIVRELLNRRIGTRGRR
ncbi:MAG: hypothetical protein LBU70_08435 [Chitinispirillales bacterium]|jgi:hypothetical protein|nr:hypothetical protein [Chitinispirillales bacterium]